MTELCKTCHYREVCGHKDEYEAIKVAINRAQYTVGGNAPRSVKDSTLFKMPDIKCNYFTIHPDSTYLNIR